MTMSGALIERLLRSASPRAASVADRQIADKAKEYLRRAHGFALAPRCEIAKPAACCALAAERFGRLDATPEGTTGAASSDGIDLARLQMLSGASAKVFEQTRAALRAALGVRPHAEAPDAGGGRSSSSGRASVRGGSRGFCLVPSGDGHASNGAQAELTFALILRVARHVRWGLVAAWEDSRSCRRNWTGVAQFSRRMRKNSSSCSAGGFGLGGGAD